MGAIPDGAPEALALGAGRPAARGENDRRVRNIFLAEKSRAIFGEMRALANAVFEDALAGIDADQRAVILSGLQTICSNLSDTDPKAAAVPKSSKAA